MDLNYIKLKLGILGAKTRTLDSNFTWADAVNLVAEIDRLREVLETILPRITQNPLLAKEMLVKALKGGE